MYRLYNFLGTCSVFRLLHAFWTYFSVDFAPKQIRSKPWYLWIYNSFCNLFSTLKVTEKIKRTMLKLSEFNEDCVCVVKNLFFIPLVFLLLCPKVWFWLSVTISSLYVWEQRNVSVRLHNRGTTKWKKIP